jgi:DNA-binding NtrC family response regulator
MAANVILLVNSDTAERSSLQLALQLRGYSVLTAVNSSGAIATAARQPKRIRLLLVDARSTGQQVDLLVEQMSKEGHESAVLVIGDGESKKELSRFQTILRPFTRTELARKVSLLIGREK